MPIDLFNTNNIPIFDEDTNIVYMSKNNEKIWYDLSKLLSYNASYNIVLGPRGCGKTYSTKQYALKQFLTKGKECVYMRRSVKEIEMFKDHIFDDILLNYPSHEIQVKGNEILYNKGDGFKTFCYFAALSSAFRGAATFPNVTTIIFDEFNLDLNRPNTRYLKNEILAFNEIIETIRRDRTDVKIFLLGNTMSIMNPYLMEWDIKIPTKENSITKTKYKSIYNPKKTDIVVCELAINDAFIKHRIESGIGFLTEGSDYELQNLYGEFTNDKFDFIKKLPQNTKYMTTISYNGNNYSLRLSDELLYFADNYEPSFNKIIAIDNYGHSEISVLNYVRPFELKYFCMMYGRGLVRFTNAKSKLVGYEILKRLVKGGF